MGHVTSLLVTMAKVHITYILPLNIKKSLRKNKTYTENKALRYTLYI